MVLKQSEKMFRFWEGERKGGFKKESIKVEVRRAIMETSAGPSGLMKDCKINRTFQVYGKGTDIFLIRKKIEAVDNQASLV